MPVSAATVTGVECDAAFFGSRPGSPVRSAKACLKLPVPTPATGWSAAIRSPFETRPARPLVAASRPAFDSSSSRCRTCGVAKPTETRTTASKPEGGGGPPAPDERRERERPRDQRDEAGL